MDAHDLQKIALLSLIQHVVDTPEGQDVSADADRLAGLIHHPDEVARLLDDAEFCMVGPNAHLPGVCPSPDSPSNHSPTSLGRAVLRRALASFKTVGHGAGHIEHVVKDFLAAGVDEQIARLPKNTGKAVSALWWATKLGTKAAFSTYLAGQNLAQDVAKLAGATPEQSLRLRAICTALDLVGAKAVPLTLASIGLGAVALPGSFIPIGSAAYLAYSTARRPLAVLRAAKSAIARLAAAPRVTEFAADAADLRTLMERIQSDDTGRYDALLCAALGHAETLEEAVALADEAMGDEDTAEFDFDSKKHPRGQAKNKGWFAKKGGATAAESPKPDAEKPNNIGAETAPVPAPADPAAGRPSKPEERHEGAAPQAKPWQPPPPKKGKKGEGMPARPKGDASQTVIGDLGEELAKQIGFRSILPPGQRSHKPGEVAEKGSTIDLEYDHSGRAYELKLCNDTATEYRLKAKASEKEAKLKFAELNKLEPYTMVGVREVGAGVVHFYAAKAPGMIGAEVSEKAFDYVGSAKL